MLVGKFDNVGISGISVAVPTQKMPIEVFNKTFGEEAVAKFSQMSGVKYLHRALPQQTASDLGYEAASDLIRKTGISTDQIGILIFVTQKPDHRVPSTAFILHQRLRLKDNCSCFDINLACSGFIFGLQVAMGMLKNSESMAALLITGDTSARTISPTDRSMIMLFGDSGTSTLIQKSDLKSPVYFSVRTDGTRFKSIITPAGAYRNMNLPKERSIWGDDILRSDYDTHMKGMDVFGFSITDVPRLMIEFMEYLKTKPEDYGCFAIHQANMYIINHIARKIKIPAGKIPISIDRFGNNSSNSVPLLLSDHYGNKQNGTVRTMMCGFGAGLSWGCCDITLDVSKINPILYTDDFYNT